MRLSYSDKNTDNTIDASEIIEETNYYPFGLAHSGYNQKNDALMKDYKYQYNGKEKQEELGLNFYDYGARNYDAAIGRWMNVDPLTEKYREFNPYAYVGNRPLNAIDPNGKEIILSGNLRRLALKELRTANPNLKINMNKKGELSVSIKKGKHADADEQKIITAINDKTVKANIKATDDNFASNGDPNLGNFLGNQTQNGITNTKQAINPKALSKWDKLSGNNGKTTNHEVTESFFGGKIAQQQGINYVGPATTADANNPNSVYSQAHNRYATSQYASFTRNMYDNNGVLIPNPVDFSVPSNVKKIEYQNTNSQNNNVIFHTINIP